MKRLYFSLFAVLATGALAASCGVNDGPSLKGYTSITDNSSTQPDPTPTPTPVPCSNAPANAHYTIPGEVGPSCTWVCDTGYSDDGAGSCVQVANLDCGAGEVAVGIYGRTGMWFDKIGVRCATFSGGAIGAATDGPAFGGNGGSAFSYDCPVGTVLRRIVGGNKAIGQGWCGDTSSVYHQYECVDPNTQTATTLSAKYGESSPGTCYAALTYDFACGTGEYVYGITVANSGDPAFVGFTLGVRCH